jgi:RNA polymerase sigma-32 factor
MSTLSLLSQVSAVRSEAGLSSYLTAIREFPLLDPAEEAAYARRLREHGDREAAYRLVTSHLRLAAKIALRYRGYGLPVGDLISEANVGLMHAVRKFDPDKGFRLATYAIWWIKAAVQEYVLKSWSLVRIGTTPAQKKLFFNLRRLKSRLGVRDDAELTTEQVESVAQDLGVTGRDVVEMNGRMRGDMSLNVRITEDGSPEEMLDLLSDDSPDPETTIAETQDRRRVRAALGRALASLPERDRRVIEARFMAERSLTLDELGQDLRISRERVRQIESRALQKIRAAVMAEMDGNSGHRPDRSAAPARRRRGGHPADDDRMEPGLAA